MPSNLALGANVDTNVGKPSNLAPGAEYKLRRRLPATIAARTVPDVPEDSIIIGVCGVDATEEALIVHRDSWFMSDFCAFNYLFKGVVRDQSWITATSEESLVQFIDEHPEHSPGFLHGNPYKTRKVVFSKTLVEQGELTPFSVYKPGKIVDGFQAELKKAVHLSKSSTPHRPLVILIFGHGTSSLGVYLDYSKNDPTDKDLFSLSSIESLVPQDIPTTVVTTSCYSGGWAIKRRNNTTVLTAAGPEFDHDGKSLEHFQSISWNFSASIGRACGSVFATTLIENLTSSTSPLYSDVSSSSNTTPESLQPTNPNEQQTETYNAFCTNIVSTLQERVTRLHEHHDFRFGAQDDEWVQSWSGRMGLPLSHFAVRWNKLADYASTAAADSVLNQDPSNLLGGLAEASATQRGIVQALEESSRGRLSIQPPTPLGLPTHGNILDTIRYSLRLTAWRLGTSCPGNMPGDYNGSCIPYKNMFLYYAQGKPQRRPENRIIDILLYRDQVALFVDHIVESFGLPQSQGKTLLDWHSDLWALWIYAPGREARVRRWKDIKLALRSAGLWFWSREDQGHPFQRGYYYLAECISLTDLSIPDAHTLIQDIAHVYKQHQSSITTECVRDRKVRQQGGKWLTTVKRRLRSLSPTKKQ